MFANPLDERETSNSRRSNVSTAATSSAFQSNRSLPPPHPLLTDPARQAPHMLRQQAMASYLLSSVHPAKHPLPSTWQSPSVTLVCIRHSMDPRIQHQLLHIGPPRHRPDFLFSILPPQRHLIKIPFLHLEPVKPDPAHHHHSSAIPLSSP